MYVYTYNTMFALGWRCDPVSLLGCGVDVQADGTTYASKWDYISTSMHICGLI